MPSNDHPSNIPPAGTWTAITTRDRTTTVGRIKFASTDLNKVRLAWGAGFWDIDLDDIRRVQVRADQAAA